MSTMSEAVEAAMVKLWAFAADAGTYIPAVGDPVSLRIRIDKHEFQEPDGLTTTVSGDEIRAKVLISEIGQEPVSKTPNRAGDILSVGWVNYEITEVVEKDNSFYTCAVREVA